MDQNSQIQNQSTIDQVNFDANLTSQTQNSYRNSYHHNQGEIRSNKDQEDRQQNEKMSVCQHEDQQVPQSCANDIQKQSVTSLNNSIREVQQKQKVYDNFQQQKNQGYLNTYLYGIQSIQKSIKKIYYRNFHNRLITFFICSLKQQQRKIRQTKQIQIKLLKQLNWPFKQLFYKKHKTQNETIMFQFINMCAQKIQATFKAYLLNKRHKQALLKIVQFKLKLGTVVKGWKLWNIYNCKKVLQLRKTARGITQQIERQIQNPHNDRFKKMKKIQYLNSNQQIVKQNFRAAFERFYECGTWIYEVDKCFKTIKVKKQTKIDNYPPYVEGKYTQASNTQQQMPAKRRKRQFNANQTTQNPKRTNKTNRENSQQLKPNKSYIDESKSVNSTHYQSSQFQQRPIVAKGQYYLDQQNIKTSENQFLKFDQQTKQYQGRLGQVKEQQKQEKRVNKFRQEQKKKLNKRKKYDPRMAIQEEKKRIQEQKKNNLRKNNQQHISNKQIGQNQEKVDKKLQKKSAKTTLKTKKEQKKEEKCQKEIHRQSSKDKTVQKVKKQSKLTKKDDNSKSLKLIVLGNKKVSSKVDCWGPKKQSLVAQSTVNQQSYKSKYLTGLKQKRQAKQLIQKPNPSQTKQLDSQVKRQQKSKSQLMRNSSYEQFMQKRNQQKMQGRQHKQKHTGQIPEQETYQSSYLKRLVDEREKGSFSYGNNNNKVLGQTKIGIDKGIKVRQESVHQQRLQQQHSNVIHGSQNNPKNPVGQRMGINQEGTKNKQQVYRSVQSLQDVYSSQYTERLNNLKGKLNMLQSTRQIQRDQSVPILLEGSKFVKKIYRDHAFSSLYWPQVRTMETNFLDYIRFKFIGM